MAHPSWLWWSISFNFPLSLASFELAGRGHVDFGLVDALMADVLRDNTLESVEKVLWEVGRRVKESLLREKEASN